MEQDKYRDLKLISEDTAMDVSANNSGERIWQVVGMVYVYRPSVDLTKIVRPVPHPVLKSCSQISSS